MDENQKIQRSINLTNYVWVLCERYWGKGSVNANIERVLRAYLESPSEQKKQAFKEINQSIAEFEGKFKTKVYITVDEVKE